MATISEVQGLWIDRALNAHIAKKVWGGPDNNVPTVGDRDNVYLLVRKGGEDCLLFSVVVNRQLVRDVFYELVVMGDGLRLC